MEMTTPSEAAADPVERPMPAFANMGLQPLVELRERFDELQETLEDIKAIGGDAVARKTQKMASELDTFAPSVTFIGQIKSGKTTLVNAMAGRPGLLPADVNPWTSVVTSIHMNVPRPEGSPVASFQFFDANEWDHLVQNGGRIGELSERTGSDKELERLQKQIAEMREKTKTRLGRKFELLLGQVHDYNSIDDKLIQRYVCLGDDFADADPKETQGQFADITKSAELYLSASNIPTALTLRDTPGMNDTFMMREQVTIRSIRDSKICVVVLSAHQALNAVDMGLIRLISNVKSRQVVIFVNRIDELANPAEQIPEIQSSLIKTLEDNNGPEDPCIIFGSAFWANAVLEDNVAGMPEASIQALEIYGSFAEIEGLEDMEEDQAVWTMSGVPALYEALSHRITESSGDKALVSVRKRAANLVAGLRASSSIVSIRANSDQIRKLSSDEVRDVMSRIEVDAMTRLTQTLDTVFQGFSERIDQAHGRFISRALDALLQHLERNGDDQVWNYSPDGLRTLMRTAYQVMRRNYTKQVDYVFEETADALTEAYGKIFDVTNENFAVAPPSSPEVPPPVTIAQTIVLDVKTSWWKRWWGGRKGYRAFAEGFRELIEAESSKIVNDLKVEQAADIRKLAEDTMRNFIEEQRHVLEDINDKSQVEIEDLHGLFGVDSQEEREELFQIIFDELDMNDMMGEAT